MLVEGAQVLAVVIAERTHEAKAVFNQHGIIDFSQSSEHRMMKREGISYEDNYAGNALAAMIRPRAFGVRCHKWYSDRRVAEILGAIADAAGFEVLSDWGVRYQGRTLSVHNGA